jgi:two-component system, cell cycle sensor histidine kinase and response regulator CckA
MPRNRPYPILRILLLIVLLSLSTTICFSTTEKQRKILILHSYHKGLGWTDSINRGIESTLAKSSVSYELFIEYMDSKRIADDQHIKNLAALFKHKYRDRHFDAIILSDDFAFNFILQYQQEIFPQTPIIFCGVNYFEDAMIKNNPFITGVVESFSMEGTINGALHIDPNLKNVIVICDDTITGKANKKLLQELIPKYQDRLSFNFIEQMKMADIQKYCSTLPPGNIVLFLGFTRDADGEIFSLERSADLIAKDCNRPIYSLWDFHLNHGIVGGKLIYGIAHGEKAAELTLRILSGETISSIPVIKESPNKYIFDYNLLKKFGISESRLPPESTIINKPLSFYSQYKLIVWQVVFVIAVLVTVILFISYNLVKQKITEKALKRSEERLQAIFQAAETVSFVITDAQEPVPNILEFSPGAEKIFGYQRNEILGSPLSVLQLSKDLQKVPEIQRRMQTENHLFSAEMTLVRKNGQQFPALFSLHPLLDEQGNTWGALVVTIDISIQKQAEASIRESMERFRELADLLPETIFEFNSEGNILFLNQNGMKQFHLTKEALSKGLNVYDFFPEKEKIKLRENISRLLQGEELGLNEYTVHDLTGKEFPVMTKSTVVFKDGKAAGLRGFLIDISEKKLLEEQLFNAQRMEAIGVLAGGIAHDFNNLLMGIQGHISLAMIHPNTDEFIKEHLQNIGDHVKSASKLTSQLLGFARSGKYHLQVTDINDMISRIAEMFGRTRKELTITQSLQKELLAVKVDRGQIEQVLLNVLVNSWQAMPNGGRLTINTENKILGNTEAKSLSLAPGTYIRITISDSGTGIDKRILTKIFEPFFTTKARGRGTGLGLASAYGIIKNHHGTIDVQSKIGDGSTFFIYLPATEEQPEIEIKETDSIIKGAETILLIDDEPMITNVGSAMLTHLGYTVHIANNGQQAVTLYGAQKDLFDLVILDMIMPELSGEETLQKLKTINPGVRVLLSSGYSLDGQTNKILSMGCCGFIQKPFDMGQLSTKIREILKKAGTELKP